MKQQNFLLAHFIAFFTVTIWSSGFIFSKFLLEVHGPVEIAFIRFSFATLALFLLRPHFFRHGLGWKRELLFFLAALFGISLLFCLENTALTHTYASNIAFITCMSPFFTGVASQIFLHETITLNFFIGFIVATIGIGCISFSGISNFGLNPLGDLLALLAAIVWACYSILMRKIFIKKLPIIETTRRILFWGTLQLLVFLFFQEETIQISTLSNSTELLHFLFLGVFASGICYLTWNFALTTLGATKTNNYLYISPVITTIESAFLLEEQLTILSFLGILLTFAGLIISDRGIQFLKNKSNREFLACFYKR